MVTATSISPSKIACSILRPPYSTTVNSTLGYV
ncbi:Uncharacterised protein [Vibrio cholerae]|nr:Uncharacterised protein [Vibrio cholerae]